MLTIKVAIASLHKKETPDEYVIIDERESQIIIFKGYIKELDTLLESDLKTQKKILKDKFNVKIRKDLNTLGVFQAQRLTGPDKLSESLGTIKITLAKL